MTDTRYRRLKVKDQSGGKRFLDNQLCPSDVAVFPLVRHRVTRQPDRYQYRYAAMQHPLIRIRIQPFYIYGSEYFAIKGL